MPPTKLPFAGGFYQSESLPLSAQQCINWYPNIPQGGALNEESLFMTPGLSQIATSGSGANRGAGTLKNLPYFVNNNTLYRVDESGVLFTITGLGTIEGTGRVSMISNGTQLMILVPGGKGYIFTTGPDTLVEITDLDFTANGNPQYLTFVDGFFVCTTDTEKFIVSALNNGTSWNALDFGSAESDPDDVVAPIVLRNQLFITGRSTIEGFQNIGGADFPFQRTGVFFDKGVSAPFSLINASDTVFFVGSGKNESPAVWAMQGNSVQKVSTTAIDSVLQDLTEVEMGNVYAIAYAQKGAYFVGFGLPDTMLVYDTITGRWHERKSRIVTPQGNAEIIPSRVSSLVTAYGKVIVADTRDGRIGEMSPDILMEYDDVILRSFTTQPFQNVMESLLFPSLELTMEAGTGNTDAPDPVMWLERSKDGKRYSDPRIRRIGKKGEYANRTIWRRNGRAARFEIFRFSMSDPVVANVLQLTADIV